MRAWQVESGLRRLSCDPHGGKPPRVIFTFLHKRVVSKVRGNPKIIEFDLPEEEPTRLTVIYGPAGKQIVTGDIVGVHLKCQSLHLFFT